MTKKERLEEPSTPPSTRRVESKKKESQKKKLSSVLVHKFKATVAKENKFAYMWGLFYYADSEQGGQLEATVDFLNGIGANGGLSNATDIIEVMGKEERPHLRLTLLDVILRTTDEQALKEFVPQQ